MKAEWIIELEEGPRSVEQSYWDDNQVYRGCDTSLTLRRENQFFNTALILPRYTC